MRRQPNRAAPPAQETGRPVVDREIASFVAATFRHADQGTYASLRAFWDDASGPPVAIRGVRLGDDLDDLIDAGRREGVQ